MSLPLFPRSGDKHTCNLSEAVTKPNIVVGEYTYYHDFDDPLRFQDRNVLYHYPVNNDRLVIGKFCSIAHGAKFLFNGGNHKQAACVNYPFAIFGELWEHELHIADSWDNRGDIVIGNDVWIGFEALVMAGVTIGDGARIGSRAIVTRDVPAYAVVAGAPAKLIRKRFPDEDIALLEQVRWWDWSEERIKRDLHLLMGDVSALRESVGE
ncbi:CatB-related O-acetyltransferase [Pseudodesulfovibrio indicus]|uniref:Acetyltransferase n=1 Tax=Pseudodesulfovibrio indicus TaxID=1716143 RepID=A0A126QL63_9BACT|nr:CatB-related O-acetyltransferase [Pseudodesulfovibrio indicus]AMK10793.1 acetyltransferase [Pseudodesulfovibrio indicus]TDT91780.1 virginiamycin A acetyltransferase [Pseudodesulfovibrio indicus]